MWKKEQRSGGQVEEAAGGRFQPHLNHLRKQLLELGGSSLCLKVGNSTKENVCRHFSASPFTEGFLQALSLTLPGRYD